MRKATVGLDVSVLQSWALNWKHNTDWMESTHCSQPQPVLNTSFFLANQIDWQVALSSAAHPSGKLCDCMPLLYPRTFYRCALFLAIIAF